MRKSKPPRDHAPRHDAPRGRRFARDERPRHFDKPRDDKRAGARDERPSRAPRDERPARATRDERPFRAPRDERPARAQRDDRPQHRARDEAAPRPRVERWEKRATEKRAPEKRATEGKPLFRPKKGWRPPVRDRDGPVFLYGWHSVKAALENPARKFIKIMATENALHRLREDGITLPIEAELVRAEAIDALVGPDAVHQGLLVETDPLPARDIDDVPAEGIILVLDQITDPHNVGAILRTAAAFGVTAVVTTQRHSPEATGVLAKAASGALDFLPMVAVTNLARALDALKDNNVFVIGLDSEGDGELSSVPIRGPLALVIGAEGKGLRQLTRATCDQVARLDLPGKLKSLNVSNATALALYVASSRLAHGT
jgi:23S rRNA (guanosine2251-2'-O)-methyltransferase